MSNVRFDCPEDTCASRAYLPPGNPDKLRCPQHKELYVQTDETPGSVFDPTKVDELTEPVVQMQHPTSPDAVTNDGRIVGDIVGVPSPGHGQGVNVLPADTAAVTDEDDNVRRGTSAAATSSTSSSSTESKPAPVTSKSAPAKK